MKKEIDWLKVGGIVCSVLGAALSIASGIIEEKKTEKTIAEQVETQVKAYMDAQNFHSA